MHILWKIPENLLTSKLWNVTMGLRGNERASLWKPHGEVLRAVPHSNREGRMDGGDHTSRDGSQVPTSRWTLSEWVNLEYRDPENRHRDELFSSALPQASRPGDFQAGVWRGNSLNENFSLWTDTGEKAGKGARERANPASLAHYSSHWTREQYPIGYQQRLSDTAISIREMLPALFSSWRITGTLHTQVS